MVRANFMLLSLHGLLRWSGDVFVPVTMLLDGINNAGRVGK